MYSIKALSLLKVCQVQFYPLVRFVRSQPRPVATIHGTKKLTLLVDSLKEEKKLVKPKTAFQLYTEVNTESEEKTWNDLPIREKKIYTNKAMKEKIGYDLLKNRREQVLNNEVTVKNMILAFKELLRQKEAQTKKSRGITAHRIFMKEKLAEINTSSDLSSFRKVNENWNQLSVEEKAVYKKKADESNKSA